MGTTVAHMDTPQALSRGISHAVSSALRAAGISQRVAAERTGIPITTLSRRLTGNSPFTATELSILADLLNVKVSELVAAAEGNAA